MRARPGSTARLLLPAVAAALFVAACGSCKSSNPSPPPPQNQGPPSPVGVVVSPHRATTSPGQTVSFLADVTGGPTGHSSAVTWSVREQNGGTIDAAGKYTAPVLAGTFHVVAVSAADGSKEDVATVVVAPPGATVAIAPRDLVLGPGASAMFSATVSALKPGQSTGVAWSIEEGAAGGTIDSTGKYTAPAAGGTYHVVATSSADATRSSSATVAVSAVPGLDADRRTVWSPGVVGGIPARTTVCATVSASTFSNGAQDAAKGIQAALNACPIDQVVRLSAGTFTIDEDFLILSKGVTLRGDGANKTILQRTNGATPKHYTAKVSDPIIVVGPNRFPKVDPATAQNLTADGVKGSLSVSVEKGSDFAPGQFVLLDEDDYATASWTALPKRRGTATSTKIFASDRAVWQKHDPVDKGVDDPFPDALTWFCRSGRPINEIKEVASVTGNVVFFTTPLHTSYRMQHAAQLVRYTEGNVQVRGAGIEDLTVTGGADGNIDFSSAAYSWMKNVEDTVWLGAGVSIAHSFRVEVRGCYIHDGAWSEPGGGGYAISLSNGSSEILVEDNVVMRANKNMVGRSAGTASVVGYNYMDDAFIASTPTWQEVGLNSSHMVGSHHVLFEGNESFNYDADCTHGNAIYHTVFRNHLTGARRDFKDDPRSGNARAIGLEYGAWWHTFLGNVLGVQGKMSGWEDEDTGSAGGSDPWQPGRFLWKLGYDPAHWEQAADPRVLSTVVRHGNFDYLTSSTKWDPGIADHTMPPSLYLTHRPAFFSAGRGFAWPWVDATAPTPVLELPAKARYDTGTPFAQP
jgi:hypothetical protein